MENKITEMNKRVKVSNCLPLFFYKGDLKNLKFVKKVRVRRKDLSKYYYHDEYIYLDLTPTDISFGTYYRSTKKLD